MTPPMDSVVYRVLAEDGSTVSEPPSLSDDELRQLYRWMVFGRAFSDRMVALQRQGRMGTFAPHTGQEASAAIATSLEPDDWLITSYRELIPIFVKGVSPLAAMDTHHGRFSNRYPRHLHVLPVQIVLATQMLHAVGVAMAIQYEGKPQVAVGVCGDGATSEGDFNEALNFAGVFQVPFVGVIHNNQWAISVPRHRQSAVPYLAQRGAAFGVPCHVVDGNDVLAVHKIMAECVARARAGDGPSLVELLTYRMGAHTTADDPTRYRSQEEVDAWKERDPILRMRRYLLKTDRITEQADEELHQSVLTELQTIVEAYEASPPVRPEEIFEHVFEAPSPQLLRQKQEILPETGNA